MEKIMTIIKKFYSIIKNWIVENGIEAILGLILGIIFWILPEYQVVSGISFGVFFTRNWFILKNWINSKKLVKKENS